MLGKLRGRLRRATVDTSLKSSGNMVDLATIMEVTMAVVTVWFQCKLLIKWSREMMRPWLTVKCTATGSTSFGVLWKMVPMVIAIERKKLATSLDSSAHLVKKNIQETPLQYVDIYRIGYILI